MAGGKNFHPKNLKRFLFAVILLTFGAVLTVFFGYRNSSNKQETVISPIQSKANIAIGTVRETATRDGIKEWSLDAGAVHFEDEKKQAVFQDLSVTFFLKDGKQVYLTAKNGILKTDSNDIEVSGNVVVKNDEYRLSTENLNYDHGRRVFFSKVPVKIVGDSLTLAADSMSLDLNSNNTLLKGHVKGSFSENFKL